MSISRLFLPIVLATALAQIAYGQEPDSALNDSPSLQSNDAPIDTVSIRGAGVAVSPSTIKWHLETGKQETKYITVTNDTYKHYKFKTVLNDFKMDDEGVNSIDPITNDSINKYSISRMINVAPTFFELKPGEKKKIAVTLSVPDNDESNFAAWGMLMIKQAKEKASLEIPDDKKDVIAMGILPSFSFGVFLFQNPPNVEVNKVELESFTYETDSDGLNRKLVYSAKNVGDGIATCKSYMEITNLITGDQVITPVRRFTVLPGKLRFWSHPLPATYPTGKYSAVTVIDYGDEEVIEAAELEFEIK